jgi:hypothetical protein
MKWIMVDSHTDKEISMNFICDLALTIALALGAATVLHLVLSI